MWGFARIWFDEVIFPLIRKHKTMNRLEVCKITFVDKYVGLMKRSYFCSFPYCNLIPYKLKCCWSPQLQIRTSNWQNKAARSGNWKHHYQVDIFMKDFLVQRKGHVCCTCTIKSLRFLNLSLVLKIDAHHLFWPNLV